MNRPEELVGVIDTWRLRELSWPIMRIFAPRFVEELERDRYVRRLLDTRQWSRVHLVPHMTPDGPAKHVFDVYGVPLDA